VGIWSGDVELHNLELRRELLTSSIFLSMLSKATWVSSPCPSMVEFAGETVKVHIEDVYLLAAPKEEMEMIRRGRKESTCSQNGQA